MLERSVAAKQARAVFFRSFNDIDIFVEDNSKETKKLYANLLTGITGQRVKIDSVFPLGPRSTVLAQCRADKDEDDNRPRIYVIDGDIDLCIGRPKPSLRRLYRLPRYCIENYLIDPEAIANILAYDSVTHDEIYLLEKIDFTSWFDKSTKPLRRLFLAYAAAESLHSGIKTVGYSVQNLISNEAGVLDPLKVEDRIVGVRRACSDLFGQEAFDDRFDEIERQTAWKSDFDFCVHFVSAKDYILPLIRARIEHVANYRRPNHLLKINLASRCHAHDLIDAIETAIAA